MILSDTPFGTSGINQQRWNRIALSVLSNLEKGNDGTYKFSAIKEIDAIFRFHFHSDELFLLKNILKPSDIKFEKGEEKKYQTELKEVEAKLNAIKNWCAEEKIDLPEAIIQFNDPNNKWEGMKDGYMKRVRNYEREQMKKSEKERSDIENEFAQTDSGDDSTELDTSKPNSIESLKEMFSKKPNMAWNDLKIELMSESVISFKIINSEIKGLRFSYTDLGMSDKRKTDLPNKMWEILIELIECDGQTSENHMTFQNRSGTEKTISRLRGKLKEITGIEGNPILFIKYPYPKRYETQFKVKDNR